MGEWFLLVCMCLASAAFSIRLLSPRNRQPAILNSGFSRDPARDDVLLFDGCEVIGRSVGNPASHLAEVEDWDGLRAVLAQEFPDFPEEPEKVRSKGKITVFAAGQGEGRDVLCEWVDGIVRVEMRKPQQDQDTTVAEREEQTLLGTVVENAPYPVWFVTQKNRVEWSNAAYQTLYQKLRGDGVNVAEPIFPRPDTLRKPEQKNRVSVADAEGEQQLWFDLTLLPWKGGHLCYVLDANAVVEAEASRRDFVQTLAKTFAQLSIGLAIFDRNRQLALFNPALIDLTNLSAEFLSARPNVSSFFDRLRNQNVMPEPKNYSGWRQQMNDLIEAAADGRFQETWSLPSGSVYSVSGRPHPNGAIAFLFEDITAEVSLTRRFRSELELGQSILDRIQDAIAVFSADGSLAFSNAAYREMWNVDPELSFANVTILDTTRTWQDQCVATPVWGDIRDFVGTREGRADWAAQVERRTGDTLNCLISPMQNGATIVTFSAGKAAINPMELTTTTG